MRSSIAGVAHVGGRQRAAFDEAEDDRTGLGVDHGGRDAGGLGGARGRELEPAKHVVDLDVLADPDHEFFARGPRPGSCGC